MIIDTETHILFRMFPRECNPGQSLTFRPSWQEHSGDLLAAEMDRAGVDKSFLISYDADDIAWYSQFVGVESDLSDTFGGRKYTLESGVKRHPSRFLWFPTLKHVGRKDTLDRMRRDIAAGALGFKIFTNYMLLRVDDPMLMEAYKIIADSGRRIIFSFEDTLPPQTPSVTECFQQLDRVLTEFPCINVQINHAGAGNPSDPASDPLKPEARIIYEVVNKHDNVWLSTALLGRAWDDGHEYPFANYLARLEALYRGVGAEKLFWATDWPWNEQHQTYPQALDAIRRHASFLSENEKRQYLGDNAYGWIKEILPEYDRAPIFDGPSFPSQ